MRFAATVIFSLLSLQWLANGQFTAPPPTFPPGVGPGDCSFEDCFCCWGNQLSGNQFDWVRGRGATRSAATGPTKDHTYRNLTGHYMYIEASDLPAKPWWGPHEGKLLSREMKAVPTPNVCYFTIWYHMRGTGVGRLTILKQPNGEGIHPELWKRTGDQGDDWLNATVDVYNSFASAKGFVLTVRADDISSKSSDIAVDDFSFSPGCAPYFKESSACVGKDICAPLTNKSSSGFTPPPPGPITASCTFETGLCSWSNLFCDDFNWFLNEGGTDSSNTGPGTDHTIGTDKGHYIYFEAGDYWGSRNRRRGQKAILESPNIKFLSGICTLKFWYHMRGSQMGSLQVYMLNKDGIRLLKEISGDKGDKWLSETVALTSSSDFRIHIIANQGDGENGDIGLDDIEMTGCQFDNSPKTSYCGSALTTGCADGSREGFFNEKEVAGCQGSWDGLKSLRDRPTKQICGNKFPDGNDAKCIVPADVCDSDNGWQVCGFGGLAREVPSLVNSGTCKSAGYGRFSAGMNHCYRRPPKVDACDKPVGNIDYGCSHYDINCDEPLCCGLTCQDPSKVECDGAFWPGASTYTPLSVYKGCSRLSSDDAGGVMCCYNKSFVPPKKPPGLCTTCTFDNDMCGFYQEIEGDFKWERDSGDTPAWNSGPDNDHTIGNNAGFYIYVQTGWSRRQNSGDVAILRSPEYNKTELRCEACMLQFYYHMYGSTVGSLEIFVEETYDKGPLSRKSVWTLSGDQGNDWKLAQIYPMNITSPTFHFLFLATATGGNYGDVAIDDITIKSCPSSPPPPPSCPPGEWRCADGRQCIPQVERCNGPRNCNDGSDESGCLTSCGDFYCVNGGSCHIKYGEQHCYCAMPYAGPRCETTLCDATSEPSTSVPSTSSPITSQPVCRRQGCNPESPTCMCDPYSDPIYCQPCEQTESNCETCICRTDYENIKVCYMTKSMATSARVKQQGTPAPQTGGEGGSSSNTGMYAAIGVSIGVVGLIMVAIVVYFIMRTKYQTQKDASSGNARKVPFDSASGIDNPAYMYQNADDLADVDKSNMFSPS